MNCASRLVELFGSQAEVARAFQLDRAVVHNWVKTGYVPARWAGEVERVTGGRIVRARFHAHRILGAGFVDDFDRTDAALGDPLHLARPTRGDVARLHPVVHHGAVHLEGARDPGLAAKDLDKTCGAIHSANSRLSN